MKATALLATAFSNPREFTDRVLTFVEGRIYRPTGAKPDGLLRTDEGIYSAAGNLKSFLKEPDLQEIIGHVSMLQPNIPLPPSGIAHNASFDLASFCYCWCRAHKPQLMIETGVANGVTSAFILKAMERNACGQLWSIDLPSLGTEDFVGCLIPKELQSRWELH